MHRKIATLVAIALFAGSTTLSFAENAGGSSNPSSAQGSSGQAIGPLAPQPQGDLLTNLSHGPAASEL